MASGESLSAGIVASVKQLGHSVLGLLKTRVELFALELQEEKLRALDLLLWLTVAIALAVAAILLLLGTVALFLWQRAGYAGLAGLVVATAAAATGAFVYLRRKILRGPGPFSGSIAEFRKDMECVRPD